MSEPPIRDDLRRQARTCAEMGSPFTARLTLLSENLPSAGPIGARLLAWRGDRDEVVPLRLAGALHALVLSGEAPDLARAYPPHDAPDEALRTAALAALREAGARATPEAPLAHLAMEGDGQPDGAALTLTLWPGGEPLARGRADFHSRWVRWIAA